MKGISGLTVIKTVFAAAIILTAGVATVLIISGSDDSTDDFMSYFSDYDDLANYLDNAYVSFYGLNGSDKIYFGVGSGSEEQNSYDRSDGAPIEYSKTNIQVEGVDEADIVKTNGELIFIASWDSVAIVNAYPPAEMMLLSYVNISDLFDSKDVYAYIQGLYVSGNELILVLSCNGIYRYNETEPASFAYASYYYYQNSVTVLVVIDVSDPISPSLKQKFEVSGNPITTRMVGDTVYAISQFYIWKSNDTYLLPEIVTGKYTETISPREIYYDPDAILPSSFLNILAVNVDDMRWDSLSILADYSSTIYMSGSSLYLTFLKWNYYWNAFNMPDRASESSSICTTTIYKIESDGLLMAVTARGDVNGYPVNQFALDEYDSYLRIATTDGLWNNRTNAVYVLDSSLAIVGSLEDIAPNESIYSARFVGNTLYLVTFRLVDPFFVIDLTNPSAPRLLGELELPGFSTYLHPIDDKHILGIGIEGSQLKISMFNVSDLTAPVEAFRYVTRNSSYSEANWDHKAVLFDVAKELLVIPVTETNFTYIDEYNYSYYYTQGAYVFKVSVIEGIELRGIIEHGSSYVQRALYIGEYLYTISSCFVKANLMSDLSPAASLQYCETGHSDDYWYGIAVRSA